MRCDYNNKLDHGPMVARVTAFYGDGQSQPEEVCQKRLDIVGIIKEQWAEVRPDITVVIEPIPGESVQSTVSGSLAFVCFVILVLMIPN